MPATRLNFGLPDLECACGAGGTLNPAMFAGHELVVVFLPKDAESASRELGDYASNCGKLVESDAWLLAFGPAAAGKTDAQSIRVLDDPEQRAWTAFCGLTDKPGELNRDRGATFFFSRGGNLHRYWSGPGHLADVLEELRLGSEYLAHGFPKD
jgi:hypothetical protein